MNCSFCNRADPQLKCLECSDNLAIYCSELCREAHKNPHQFDCSVAKVWSKLRHLYKPSLQFVVKISTEFGVTANHIVVKNMHEYLSRVPTSARPETLVTTEVPRLKIGIYAYNRLMAMQYEDEEAYMADREKWLPAAERLKQDNGSASEIPYRFRPFINLHLDEESFEEIIELFPGDFKLLPLSTFVDLFGEGKRYGINPLRHREKVLG